MLPQQAAATWVEEGGGWMEWLAGGKGPWGWQGKGCKEEISPQAPKSLLVAAVTGTPAAAAAGKTNHF